MSCTFYLEYDILQYIVVFCILLYLHLVIHLFISYINYYMVVDFCQLNSLWLSIRGKILLVKESYNELHKISFHILQFS